MRIAIDASYAAGEKLTGIGIYSRKLISALAASFPADVFVLAYRLKQWRHAPAFPFANVRRSILQIPFPFLGANVFHALNQRVDRRPAPKVVATFHDLFVMTAEYSTREFRTRFTEQARRAARNSDRIIAVSSFTADQVHDLLGVERSRISVVFHGVDFPENIDEGKRTNTVLFVGALQKRKNVVRLVKAFERMDSTWRLVLAGALTGYGAETVMDAIARSTARDRIDVKGHVTAECLDTLYRQARIFAFPSLDEGFGIPLLEAMAYNVPVLTSRAAALPEVAGPAGFYVDALNEEEIGAGLVRLSEDADLRFDLAKAGRQQARLFSWEKTARATYDIYRQLHSL